MSWTLIGVILCLFTVRDSYGKFKNIGEVQAFYANGGDHVREFIAGNITAEEFGKELGIADDFEEYVGDARIIGKSQWLEMVGNTRLAIKSMETIWDVESWTQSSALVSFFYIYTFMDDSTMNARGKEIGVWNEKGEVSRWIYFSTNGSLEACMAKMDQFIGNEMNKRDSESC